MSNLFINYLNLPLGNFYLSSLGLYIYLSTIVLSLKIPGSGGGIKVYHGLQPLIKTVFGIATFIVGARHTVGPKCTQVLQRTPYKVQEQIATIILLLKVELILGFKNLVYKIYPVQNQTLN